jgi:hypothetical protein
MAATYTPIASIVNSSVVSSVTFDNIPATYTDLILIALTMNSVSADNNRMRFNGNTGSIYRRNRVTGNGSTVVTSQILDNGFYIAGSGSPSSYFATTTIQINNYSNANTFKPILVRQGDATASLDFQAGVAELTAAISSITIYPNSNNFAANCTFNLYGILGANA